MNNIMGHSSHITSPHQPIILYFYAFHRYEGEASFGGNGGGIGGGGGGGGGYGN